MSKDPQKIIFYTVRTIVALAGWGAALFVLYRYGYFSQTAQTGATPIALLVTAAAAFTVLMLLPAGKNTRYIAIILTAVIAVAVALTPSALRGDIGASACGQFIQIE